jgi:hypothetical protein
MPDYVHIFRCTLCNGKVIYKTTNPDCDNPPLPSLFHNDLARHVGDNSASGKICGGRMLWQSSSLIPAAVIAAPPPVKLTAAGHSLKFTEGNQPPGVNTICAALDITTNRFKKGVNGHRIPRYLLHPTLQEILGRVEQLEHWDSGNCAEIQAVHKLLVAHAQVGNIRVHSRYPGGGAKPPCENCQGWLTPAGESFKIR